MKDLDKILKLKTITRKDLKDEGISDYEIKKFSLVIGSLFMYACYASTYEFSPINVIMFLFIIILMLFLYRKYMRDIVKFFKKLKKD